MEFNHRNRGRVQLLSPTCDTLSLKTGLLILLSAWLGCLLFLSNPLPSYIDLAIEFNLRFDSKGEQTDERMIHSIGGKSVMDGR